MFLFVLIPRSRLRKISGFESGRLRLENQAFAIEMVQKPTFHTYWDSVHCVFSMLFSSVDQLILDKNRPPQIFVDTKDQIKISTKKQKSRCGKNNRILVTCLLSGST